MDFTEFVKMVLKADGPDRQFKSAPILYTAPGSKGKTLVEAGKAVADERVVSGIVCVHGNVDSGSDRSHPGAFTKTLAEGRSRVRHLWNHSFSNPPTAAIQELKELTKDELPAEIFEFAPEATGGLYVSRKYLKSARGDEILEAIVEGAVTEMSYGYATIRYDYETLNEGTAEELRIRNLYEMRLYDTSDVLWGMNDSTLADIGKALTGDGAPLEAQLKAALAVLKNLSVKEGRRNSDADAALVKQIHELAVQLEPSSCSGQEQAGDKAAGERRAATTDESPDVDALTLRKHRVALAEIENLLVDC